MLSKTEVSERVLDQRVNIFNGSCPKYCHFALTAQQKQQYIKINEFHTTLFVPDENVTSQLGACFPS